MPTNHGIPMPVEGDAKAPRVLYIGDHAIGFRNSSGITLANLYADYPREAITQYTPHAPGVPAVGLVVSVPRVESLLTAPFAAAYRGFLRTRRGGGSPSPHNSVKVERQSRLARLAGHLAAAADLAPVRLPLRTRKLLRKGEPEVIHAIIGRMRTLRRVLKAARVLGIPVVPHLTDDWIGTIFPNGELGGRARARALRLVGELMERSPVLLVIGDAMAAEYGHRYGKPCVVAAAAVDPADFAPAYASHSGPRRLLYVGSPHVGRAEMADRVALFAKDRGWEVVVHPLLPELWRQWSSVVTIAEQLPSEDVPAALCRADALLFPESLDPGVADYTRLSVSTKLSQFIASGRPILAIGPAGQGSIEELRHNAPRAIVLDGVDDARLDAGFGYLEAHLDPAPAAVPEKYLASRVRAAMTSALAAAVGGRTSLTRASTA